MLEYKEGISKATIARLPIYLRFLRDRQAAGERYASSTQIADRMRLNPVQVRKDLALVSSESGRPKLGFRIDELIEDIERFLGCDNVNDALIVGVGGLGRTLLAYEGFRNYGLNIVAAFDSSPEIVGRTYGGLTVQPVGELVRTAVEKNVKMGIITVPKSAAQGVAEVMVAGGIRAIWNFAPAHLSLPDNIAVKNEDLAASLAVLSRQLKNVDPAAQ